MSILNICWEVYKIKAYIAGPLFTESDRWYLEIIDKICRENNIDTYLPHRDGGICPSDGRPNDYIFRIDYKNIEDSHIIVAVLHGTDVDSGTAWEMGCAYEKKKEIFAVADDIRIAGLKTNINPMISNSCKIYYNLDNFENALKSYVERNKNV